MPRPLARPLARSLAAHAVSRGVSRRGLTLCAADPRRAAHQPHYARHARHALANTDRAADAREHARERARRARGRGCSRAFAVAAKRAMKHATLRDCGRRCVYCAVALGFDTLTLDHVYPRARGGPDVAGNVVAACGPCNRLKADLLPSEFFHRHPWAGLNFVRHARAVHRALKRHARRAVSLACAAGAGELPAAA